MRDGLRMLVGVVGFALGAILIRWIVGWFSPRPNARDGSPLARWILWNFASSVRGSSSPPVPPARQALSCAGLVISGAGLALSLSPFVRLLSNLGTDGRFEGNVEGEVFRGFGGVILMIVGRFVMYLGKWGWGPVGITPRPESTPKKLNAALHGAAGAPSCIPWDVEAVRRAEAGGQSSDGTAAGARCD